MNSIAQAFQNVSDRTQAVEKMKRSVQIVAVTKRQSIAQIKTLLCGEERHCGENYVQEALPKIKALSDEAGLIWHFIGRLQSNKVKIVAEKFDWIQTIDSIKLLSKIDRYRPAEKMPINVCIQVNCSHDPDKGGVAFEEVESLLKAAKQYERICLRGLMAIPKQGQSETERRADYKRLYDLFVILKQKGFNLDTLSMGMSNDFELAIEEGATMVRIGSAIFGERK